MPTYVAYIYMALHITLICLLVQRVNEPPGQFDTKSQVNTFLWLDFKLIENLSSYNEQEMSGPKDTELAFNLHQGTIIQLTRARMKTEWTVPQD